MVPVRKEHSHEFRETIMKRFLVGNSERTIAEDLLCSRNTVHSVIIKYKKQNVQPILSAVVVKENPQNELTRPFNEKLK
jgi:hypothetical protein